MHHSIWLYPWDLIDRDLSELTDTLSASGIRSIDLAFYYHNARAASWGNPKRGFIQAEDGLAYYQPDASLFGRIQPTVSPLLAGGNPVVEAADRLVQQGFELRAWTIFGFNRRIGDTLPECCVHNALGDRHLDVLSPAHEDVRAFYQALTEDLCRNTPIQAISLEEFEYTPFAFCSQIDKSYPIDPLIQNLLTLCFSPASRAHLGSEAGALAARVAQVVRHYMDTLELPDAHAIAQVVQPVLHAQQQVIAENLQACAAVARNLGKQIDLIVGYTPEQGRWLGIDMPQLQSNLDALTLLAYGQTPDAVTDFVTTWKNATDLPLRGGLTMVSASDKAQFVGRASAAAAAGAECVLFYNYGIVPAPVRQWMAPAVQAYQRAANER